MADLTQSAVVRCLSGEMPVGEERSAGNIRRIDATVNGSLLDLRYQSMVLLTDGINRDVMEWHSKAC